MLTNDFGNPFLARSLLQFRGKMGIPFLALKNELDGFALSFHTGKTRLPHLAPLSQHTNQLHPQQPQLLPQHPTPNHHPLQFLHPSYYSLHPSHYPRVYAGAAAAAAAAAAAIEQSIPFSHHVMAVTPSMTKAFLPQALSMKNSDTVGIGTLGVDFHRGNDKNNNNDNNNNNNSNNNSNNASNNNKGVSVISHIGRQSANSPTIEDKIPVLNDNGTTRSIISQSVRTGAAGCIDVGNNNSNSNNNHNMRLIGSVGPTHDPHRNLMFYQGREKSERGRKIFLCPQCHYVTDRKNNLKRHIITMHQDCPKILECCGVMFRSKAMLREHVSLFHSSGYRCRVCGRNFCRKALLRRHLSVHSGQKDFICPLCSYATSHKSNLERHQKVHNKKSTLNGIGVSSSGMKGLSEELSKVSVVAEVPETSFDHDSPTSQVCTPTADTYFDAYRSPPIEAAIGIPRIKKFLLPDRLNQTYTDVRSQSIGSDAMDSGKDIAVRMLNDHEDSERSNENYRYRHVYTNSSDSSSSGDNHHLYTHHHHHHHHHHHINTTVTSLQMADNHQSASSGKIIKRKPPRIFMTSYKCIDCRKVFPHQSLLNSHSCLNDRPNGEGYLSIVRPLAKKQPVKQIMTLASQGPTTSTAVVVVSTSVNNWCESINRYPLPSIRSQPHTPNGSLAEEEMVAKASCYSGYSPVLCSNTCERTALKSKSDQTVKNISSLFSRNSSKDEFFMDVSNDNNDYNNSNPKEKVRHNDKKPTSADEHDQVNSKCTSVECSKMDIGEQIDEKMTGKFSERPGWRQQKDGVNTEMKGQRENQSEKELPEHLKRYGRKEATEMIKEEHLESIELTDDVKVEVDVIDDHIDDSDYDELEEDRMPLPFKKRPIKENDTEADEVVDAWVYVEAQ